MRRWVKSHRVSKWLERCEVTKNLCVIGDFRGGSMDNYEIPNLLCHAGRVSHLPNGFEDHACANPVVASQTSSYPRSTTRLT